MRKLLKNLVSLKINAIQRVATKVKEFAFFANGPNRTFCAFLTSGSARAVLAIYGRVSSKKEK